MGDSYDPATSVFTAPANPGPQRLNLVITSISADTAHAATTSISGTGTVVCPVGTVITAQVEMRTPDGSAVESGFSGVFCLPVRKQGNGDGIILVNMANGEATVSRTFAEEGIWTITSDGINAAHPHLMDVAFDGITFYVFSG